MECICGSHKPSWRLYDARGIYVSRVCKSCITAVKAKYRPEIFEDSGYDVDESIEEDL
jgi:hypothetical protein